MNKNNNENASKAEYASAEDLLYRHRTATNEATLISEIPKQSMRKILSLHPVKKNRQFLSWVMNFVKSKDFFPKVNLAIVWPQLFQ